MPEPLGIALEEEVTDATVGDGEEGDREDASVEERHHGGLSVQCPLDERETCRVVLRGEGLDHGGDARSTDHRLADPAEATEARRVRSGIDDEHGVLGEQGGERGCVTGRDGVDEGEEKTALLVVRGLERAPFGGDVVARALEDLPTCAVALAEEGGDLEVVHVEDVVQEEDGALGGGEPLQEHEERHRDLVERLEACETAVVEIDRLGEAVAAVLFATCARRAEVIETEARHGGEQESLGRVDLDVGAVPAEPCILDDVFGAGEIAEHAIGEREERGAVGLEDVGVGGHGFGEGGEGEGRERARMRLSVWELDDVAGANVTLVDANFQRRLWEIVENERLGLYLRGLLGSGRSR